MFDLPDMENVEEVIVNKDVVEKDKSPLIMFSDNQKKMLDNAIKKQEKFLNGDVQKKRVTKKDLKSLE